MSDMSANAATQRHPAIDLLARYKAIIDDGFALNFGALVAIGIADKRRAPID